jgi:predicted Zn-ribbon and HTH transcriptional regulator
MSNYSTPDLREDELRLVAAESKRCKTCGHMQVFHNEHCCMFCKVPDCKCEWEAAYDD